MKLKKCKSNKRKRPKAKDIFDLPFPQFGFFGCTKTLLNDRHFFSNCLLFNEMCFLIIENHNEKSGYQAGTLIRGGGLETETS